MWEITSNAYAYTGDGAAITMRRGLPLEDMEFFQFHPTGIYKLGILITEAVRGEGGVPISNNGERFMERYAPRIKDLASRDVISRAMYLEIREGRGINGSNYLMLDIRPETVNKYAELDGRLRPVIRHALQGNGPRNSEQDPGHHRFFTHLPGRDPVKAPMPVQPTAHYAMVGSPTNKNAEVIIDSE